MITNPIWVVNTRMTARKEGDDQPTLPTSVEGSEHKNKKSSPTTTGTLMKIIKEEGPLRLFAGVLPALVLVINPILQYTIFERLKDVLEKRRRVTPTDSFYLGAIGKLLATSITYPYITVKSRAHVASGSGSKEGMFTSFNRILKEEGWSGLYGGKYPVDLYFDSADTDISKGIGPKVTQSVLTAAFLFAFKDALYEMTIRGRKTIAARKAAL